ncbi:MAG: DUF3054 domain-containing protein [Actinomycetota bacterium]
MPAPRLTDGSRGSRVTLAIDVVALALFVVAGMTSHHEGSQAAIFLRNFVPVTVCWLLLALLVPTYRPPRFSTMLLTWAIAVPAGLLVRSAIHGDLGDPDLPVFFAVALSFTLAFLAIGRAVASLVTRRLPAGRS